MLLAAGVGQAITSFLFGVQPLDWSTFATVGGLLIVTAAIAVAAPALRATRVDPVVAFRND
jgi:ABC-type antimicrobial peptide transport system permease subunit